MHTKITKRVLEGTVLPSTGAIFLRDTELRGFGARISAKGSITFFAEGRLRRSRNKRVSLGRYPVVTVDKARERARRALFKLSSGIDPIREAKARSEANRLAHAFERARSVTLAEVIDDYFKCRPIKSEPDYRAVLNNTFAGWMGRPIRSIARREIECCYRKVAVEKGRKPQATKAMRYLSAIMNFAKAEFLHGQPLLADNPVDVLKDKKVDRTIRPRDNYVPIEKLGAVIRAVRDECTETARDLLLLELFTGLRDGEAKKLKWSDVDLERRIVTISQTKNGKPHVFGMGQFVLCMMKHRHTSGRHDTYVFPNSTGTGPLGSIRKQLARVHKKAGFVFTHHDLRRTFATMLSGEIGVPDSTISKLLNHSPTGVTARHYIKSDASKFTAVYDRLYELLNSCFASEQKGTVSDDIIHALYAPAEEIEVRTHDERAINASS